MNERQEKKLVKMMEMHEYNRKMSEIRTQYLININKIKLDGLHCDMILVKSQLGRIEELLKDIKAEI